jgi:uncharacterized membrane protein
LLLIEIIVVLKEDVRSHKQSSYPVAVYFLATVVNFHISF